MKQKILVDLHIECVPDGIGIYSRTLEGKAKEMERWCKDFEEFMRDHRSLDAVSMTVVREYQEQCSHCGYEWEIDETGYPACCQAAIDEFEKNK